MKIFIYILLALAAGLFIFNLTQLDYNNIFSEDGTVALISTLAAASVVVLLLILVISRKISAKNK